MIAAGHFEARAGDAVGREPGGEGAALALELRRLNRAPRDDGRAEPAGPAQEIQRRRRRRVQAERVVDRRADERREVVDA